MVVFNIIAIVELLLGLAVYWALSMLIPGLEEPSAIALGDTTTGSLVLCTVLLVVTGASEVVGLRGRLFWLPTHGFVALWLGNQLTTRIGVAGWVVAAIVGVAVLGFGWWLNRDGGEVSEAEAHQALATVDEAVGRHDLPAAWAALESALLPSEGLSAAGAQHNRVVLARVLHLVPPQHQAFAQAQLGSLDSHYGRIAAGSSPEQADLSSVVVVRAIIEARGEIPPSAYETAGALERRL